MTWGKRERERDQLLTPTTVLVARGWCGLRETLYELEKDVTRDSLGFASED